LLTCKFVAETAIYEKTMNQTFGQIGFPKF